MYNVYYFESKKDNPLIVDCGANIGISAIYFKYLYPNCHIECYEPDEASFKTLKMNIDSNGLKNVKVYKKAISDKDGQLTFYSDSNISECTGNSSCKELLGGNNVREIKVESTRLSSLNHKHIDCVKMDIEGGEGAFFKDIDSSKYIDKIDNIIFEYHYNDGNKGNYLGDILKILENYNFSTIINGNIFQQAYIYIPNYTKPGFNYILMVNAFKRIN